VDYFAGLTVRSGTVEMRRARRGDAQAGVAHGTCQRGGFAMTQNASVTVTGYVAMEPKLVLTKLKQTPVVNLRIGTTHRRLDSSTGEWRELGTSFFTVNCWNRLAFSVVASLRKGNPIIVRGRLKTRSWNDNGTTRTTHEIEADAIGHDLVYGWSHFMRGLHPSQQEIYAALTGTGGFDGASAVAGGLPDAGFSADGGFPAVAGFSGEGAFGGAGAFPDEGSFGDGPPDDGDLVATPRLDGLELPRQADGETLLADGGADALHVNDLTAEAIPF
jgi:single-strand DNA-binding protein